MKLACLGPLLQVMVISLLVVLGLGVKEFHESQVISLLVITLSNNFRF